MTIPTKEIAEYLKERGWTNESRLIPYREVKMLLGEFAEQQVKKLNMPGVSNRRELLLAFLDWLNSPASQCANSTFTETLDKYLATVPVWKLHQEHDEEIKRVMDATGCTFHKWNGKAFWELANECGHTSLDFNKCGCKRHCW